MTNQLTKFGMRTVALVAFAALTCVPSSAAALADVRGGHSMTIVVDVLPQALLTAPSLVVTPASSPATVSFAVSGGGDDIRISPMYPSLSNQTSAIQSGRWVVESILP